MKLSKEANDAARAITSILEKEYAIDIKITDCVRVAAVVQTCLDNKDKAVTPIEPNTEALRKELDTFFKQNTICGRTILSYQVQGSNLVAIDPPLENIDSDGARESDILEIGRKYGLENLSWAYWQYHK